MKQDVTIVGAIEDSTDRFVEKEYLLMVRSLRRNGGFYADAPVILFQPTNKDISIRTRIELSKLDVTFIRNPSPIFKNTGRGFLNMPYTCDVIRKYVHTDQMVWLDCDTIILKEPIFESIYPDEVSVHHNMAFYDKFFNKEHELAYNEDMIAQSYLYNLVMKGAKNPLRHVNTWFIQTTTTSKFWHHWNHLTDNFVDYMMSNQELILNSEFVGFSGQGEDKTSMDYAISSAEEITAGILDNDYNYREPLNTAHQYIDEDVRICHYDDWDILRKINKDPFVLRDMKEINKICR